MAIEAWWWTGEVAAGFASPARLDLAAGRAGKLARNAGSYADTLRRAAAYRLDSWRAVLARGSDPPRTSRGVDGA